jgi:hypothetical protein
VGCREQRFRFGCLFNDARGAGKQGAPVFVEHQALADTVEKLDPERCLQFGQRVAGRRLGAGHLLRRGTCRPPGAMAEKTSSWQIVSRTR